MVITNPKPVVKKKSPPTKSREIVCKCGKLFTNWNDYGEHKKACGKKPKPKESPKPVAPTVKAPPPPKPQKPGKILLKYVWEGSCPDCSNPVDTIDIQSGKQYISIAYCMTCRKQLRERPVVKL